MQRSPSLSFTAIAGAILLAATLSSGARAAELGDVSVRSHIGQQLSADIELVMLAPDEADGLVQVRLAGTNIYQGANVRMHPALASLRMSVVKRDQRQFLHLTTLQPVDAELVHLFLELGTGNRTAVRSATVWLTPDQARTTASSPAPAPVAAIAAAPASGPAQAASAPAAPALPPAPAALAPAARPAPAPRELPAVSPVETMPSDAAMAAATARTAQRAARLRAAAAEARSAQLAKVTAPAEPSDGGAVAGACAPGKADEQIKQCVALGEMNVELNTKLVGLEGKVKQLQAALGQGGAAAVAPVLNKSGTVPPPSAPAGKVKKDKKSGSNTIAIAIGGLVLLALLGGLLAYLIRRKNIRFSTAPLKVWQGWRKHKKLTEAKTEPVAEAIGGGE
jgi:pilus assembly protein FimV